MLPGRGSANAHRHIIGDDGHLGFKIYAPGGVVGQGYVGSGTKEVIRAALVN